MCFLKLIGLLISVSKNAIYKAPLPNYSQPLSFSTWLYKATHVFDMPGLMVASLVFDPDGKLYFVVDDKLYMMLPNSTKSYKELAVKGWSAFKFLFFNPEGILYGVENGKLHKRGPPTAPDDDWLATSTVTGTVGWNDFQLLFFMSSSFCMAFTCPFFSLVYLQSVPFVIGNANKLLLLLLSFQRNFSPNCSSDKFS